MGSGATCSLRHTICVSAGSTSDSWCSFVCTSSNGMYVSMHRSIRTCARCTSLTVVMGGTPLTRFTPSRAERVAQREDSSLTRFSARAPTERGVSRPRSVGDAGVISSDLHTQFFRGGPPIQLRRAELFELGGA